MPFSPATSSMAFRIHDGDRDDVIAFVRTNAPDADRVAALIAQLLLVKAEAHPFLGDQDDLVIAVGQLGVDQAIVLLRSEWR